MGPIAQMGVTLRSLTVRNCFLGHQEQVLHLIWRRNNMMRAFVTLFLCIYVLSITAASQTRPIPRTADVQPDLQGILSFASITPLEPPPEHAGRLFFGTDKEAAERAGD